MIQCYAVVHCCLFIELCMILCNPLDCSQPGSSVHGISQARILEWVAVSFSRGSSQPRWNQCLLHGQADSLPLSHQERLIQHIWHHFIYWFTERTLDKSQEITNAFIFFTLNYHSVTLDKQKVFYSLLILIFMG